MKASEVLKAAGNRLIETGWAQGEDGPDDGPNCLQGAIMHEATTRKLAQQALEFTALAIAEHEKGWNPSEGIPPHVSFANMIGSVTHWNDRPERKESTVIGIIGRAAIIAKEYESRRPRRNKPSALAVTAV